MIWADVETYFVFDWEKQFPQSFHGVGICGTTFDCCVLVGVCAFVNGFFFVNLFCRSNTCWENGCGSATSLELEKKAKRPSQLLLPWWESLCALYLCVRVWTTLPNPPHHLMRCSYVFLCVRFSFINREFFERMIWSRGFSASVRNCVWRLHTELWEIT